MTVFYILLVLWGLTLALLIAGMLKAAKTQDEHHDEANSRYETMKDNNV